ncbi:Extracellular mutant protein 11 domain containing protein [Elaphomyces granulatus]
MAVGDFVNSKDASLAQPHLPTMDRSSSQRQSRQALAEQARVAIPATRLTAPVSFAAGQQGQQGVQDEAARHKNPFDTDVEGVDDSTIDGTSVAEIASAAYSSARLTRMWNEDQIYDTDRTKRLGDRAMKAAGFESDDADPSEAPPRSAGSSNGEENDDDGGDVDADDEVTQIVDWRQSQDHRSLDATTMSARLEGHLRATSKKMPSRLSPNPTRTEIGSSARFTTRTGQLAYPNGNGMNTTLPQSLGNTPRNRFNFKDERPYERFVQLSPTRRASGPRPQPSRPASTTTLLGKNEKWTDPNASQEEQHTKYSTSWDLTDEESLADLDKVDNGRPKPPSSPKKRPFVSDYSEELLDKKSFSDLQDESFDYTPSSNQALAIPPQSQPAQTAAERLSLLLTLSNEGRHAYLSNLSIEEWEECGDELITEFSSMLLKMKEARHARRKTAAAFETEIKRRHDQTQIRDAELGKKLAEMKAGGMGVLRGVTP